MSVPLPAYPDDGGRASGAGPQGEPSVISIRPRNASPFLGFEQRTPLRRTP